MIPKILFHAILLWQAQQTHKPHFVTQGRVYPDCDSANRAFNGCSGFFFYDDPGHWECDKGYKPDGIEVIWSDSDPEPHYRPKECVPTPARKAKESGK